MLPLEATDKSVTWTSSDETVATVDANGQVTPKAKGIATITATTTDGGKKATSTVYVYDKIIDISAGAAVVTAGESWLINGDGTAVANGITIGDGATVTLNGINISKQIICSSTGDATIILADGSTNTVTAPNDKAGLQIGGTGKTLTINAETAGTGTLTAQGGNSAAGIGSNYSNSSAVTGGNIVINGGKVTATGGGGGAGIGTGVASNSNTCGAITINGGTVTATGVQYGAGIGTGWAFNAKNECGAITIKVNVTSVTATKGNSSPNSIGIGYNEGGTQNCGTITIGGVVKAQSNFTAATYTYEP